MADVNINDVVRITARMFLDGIHEVNNVYHFRAISANLTDAAAYMAGVAAEMDVLYTLLNADISSRLTYTNIEGINVTQDTLLPAALWPFLVAGSTGTELLPEMNAVCVFFRTTRPKTRTAKFLAGYTEPSSVGGALLPAVVTAVNAYGDRLLGGFAADGAVMQYGAFNSLAVRFTLVVSRVVPTRFRTQRRRRFGVGS